MSLSCPCHVPVMSLSCPCHVPVISLSSPCRLPVTSPRHLPVICASHSSSIIHHPQSPSAVRRHHGCVAVCLQGVRHVRQLLHARVSVGAPSCVRRGGGVVRIGGRGMGNYLSLCFARSGKLACLHVCMCLLIMWVPGLRSSSQPTPSLSWYGGAGKQPPTISCVHPCLCTST
jgi:hypothetical protein